MKLYNALAAMAAAGVLVSPIAAQAGTTASASVGKISNLSGVGARQSSVVKKKSNAESGTIILAAVGVVAVGAGIYAIADDGDKSNGS